MRRIGFVEIGMAALTQTVFAMKQKGEKMRLIDADKLESLCDIMADKCDGAESIWNQFKTVVEWCPTVEIERHLCRECACVQYYGEVDKYGNVESSWYCCNWDNRTDEEGFCHEWRRK